MPTVHHFWVERERFKGVEAAVAGFDPEDLANAVHLPEPHHELPDDGVHPGAEAAAGDDGGAHSPGFEVDFLPRPGTEVGEGRRGRREGAGEVEGALPEDDVGGGKVEAWDSVVEGVAV